MTNAPIIERQIEDVFEQYHELLIEPGLRLLGRQQRVPGSRLRVDLLFEGKGRRKVVVELKKDTVSREDVGQLLEYAGLIPNSRVILAAPRVPSSIKTSFEHYRIEYIEFSVSRVGELLRALERKGSTATKGASPKVKRLVRGVVSKPLAARSLRDGNIAFKVAFNDRGWRMPCSPDVFHYNVFEKQVPWCALQAENNPNCQSKVAQSKRKDAFIPC